MPTVAATTDPWIAEIARLQAQRKAAEETPIAPMFSPEEVAQRRKANQLDEQWGALGSMTDDSVMQNLGGTFLKKALADRQEKVSDHSVVNPLEGTQRYLPGYIAQRRLEAADKDLERGYAGRVRSQDAAQAREERRADRAAFQQPQRDRFQVIADTDGTQYRVNLDTGEKFKLDLQKPAHLTEQQGNATLFGTRMQAADKVLETVGTNYSPMTTAVVRGVEGVPGINAAANTLAKPNDQMVLQAQRDFVNAVLRKESGAAINASEFANAQKQYFPQVGDRPQVLAQKKANRQLAIQGMRSIAGRGASGSFEAPPATGKTVKWGDLK